MKTCYLTLPALVCLLAGCIKDPEGPPPPQRPQWLINKVVQLTEHYGTSPLPGDPPIGYDKLYWEIEYNADYKPRLRRVYFNDWRTDTLNTQLATVDTLRYDAQLRVKEVHTLTLNDNKVTVRKFSYTGNDTLPSLIQQFSTAAQDTSATAYLYRGDTVISIFTDVKGAADSSFYIYPGGNLTHYHSAQGYVVDVYSTYDEGPAIETYMNLSIGTLFSLPFTFAATPRLSRGNWTTSVFFGEMYRSVLYNAEGLPVSSSTAEYVPNVKRFKSRYEYIATAP